MKEVNVDNLEVIILMATYNGEQFLRKQLDSIIGQTYSNWKLLIRDDKSNDTTLKILEEYKKQDERIDYIINNTQNHGWQQNFQKLLQSVEKIAPYYMFCDQDDIWLPNKIEKYLIEMKKLEGKNKSPVVIYGNMQIINKDDDVVNPSFQTVYDMKLRKPTDSFFSQRVYGCSMMFNKQVLDGVIQLLKGNIFSNLSHDGLVVKVCALLSGSVFFIDTPYTQYRRFENNATVSQEFIINKNRILKAICNFKKLAISQASTYKQSILVLELVEKNYDLAKSDAIKWKKLKNAINNGGFKSLLVLIKFKINCGNIIRTISHIIVLLSNCWKE